MVGKIGFNIRFRNRIGVDGVVVSSRSAVVGGFGGFGTGDGGCGNLVIDRGGGDGGLAFAFTFDGVAANGGNGRFIGGKRISLVIGISWFK